MDTQVQAFINSWRGKPLEVEDASNLDECFDLAFGWCDLLGIPHSAIRHLYAYEIWTDATPETRQYFDLVQNTPEYVPPAGALAIWRPSGRFTGIAGHVDLVRAGSTQQSLQSFDQNWDGHLYCEEMTHPYDDVMGFLVPHNQGNTTMAETAEQVENRLLHEPGGVDDWKSQTYEANVKATALQGQLNDALGQVNDLTKQVKGQQDTIRDLNAKNGDLTEQVTTLHRQLLTATQGGSGRTVGTALPGVEPTPVTPGYKTTEFWTSAGSSAVGFLILLGDVPLPAGSPVWLEGVVKSLVAVGAFANTVFYAKQRRDVKVAAIQATTEAN